MLPRALAPAVLALLLWAPGARGADPVVRFTTSLGAIDVQLLPGSAPKTVENFLRYADRKAYDGGLFHRSAKDFVIQGGGFAGDPQAPTTIPQDPPVVNEPGLSNVRGTLAMAKLGSDPNSATNQWFFNLRDTNAGNLDTQNGGFTVFGRVTAGLQVVDAIAALPTTNVTSNSAFGDFPVRDWTSGTPVRSENAVSTTTVARLPEGATPPSQEPPPTTTTPVVPTPPPTTRPRPAAPFRLASRAIDAPNLGRRATRLRVVVTGLPGGTRLTGVLKGTGRALTVKTTAKGGRAVLNFRITKATRAAIRRRRANVLQVSVRAVPPGVRSSTASATLLVRR